MKNALWFFLKIFEIKPNLPRRRGMELIKTEQLENRKNENPERNLLVATLDRAVLDLIGSHQRDKNEAIEWFFDEADENEPFSFSWVCSNLDIDKRSVIKCVDKLLRSENAHEEINKWGRVKVLSLAA